MRDCRLRILFAVLCTLACSERSGTTVESSVTDYCGRVCNCADTVTDVCVEQCSNDFKANGNTLGQDCLSCAQTTACGLISTDCQDVCGGLVSSFPDAGPQLSPDGGVPGCPTGRLDMVSLYLLFYETTCPIRVECGFDESVESCVAQNMEQRDLEDYSQYECDPGAALDCLAEAATASCDLLAKSGNFVIYTWWFPSCSAADDTCCDTQLDTGNSGEGEGEEGESESEGETERAGGA